MQEESVKHGGYFICSSMEHKSQHLLHYKLIFSQNNTIISAFSLLAHCATPRTTNLYIIDLYMILNIYVEAEDRNISRKRR